MPTFDPDNVRKAVAEFSPRRPQKFQDLLPAREVIAELRQKKASYEAIADLLTQHCLPTSKTAIAQFCHAVLGEVIRPHRRGARRRQLPVTISIGADKSSAPTPEQPLRTSTKTAADSGDDETTQPTRGPRIAQIRLAKQTPA